MSEEIAPLHGGIVRQWRGRATAEVPQSGLLAGCHHSIEQFSTPYEGLTVYLHGGVRKEKPPYEIASHSAADVAVVTQAEPHHAGAVTVVSQDRAPFRIFELRIEAQTKLAKADRGISSRRKRRVRRFQVFVCPDAGDRSVANIQL